MLLLIYTLLIYVLAPLALVATAWRGIRDPPYRERLGERFGWTRVRFDVPVIWVHAVSMGEVQAAAPLVRELRRRYPDIPLLMTTATPTGAQRVVDLFKGEVQHAYLPYDTPDSVSRFLNRVRPLVAIVLETELWPHLLRACQRRDIPVILASARLSPRSVRRLHWAVSLFRPVLRHMTIAAQTQADADRFIALGAPAGKVIVCGNIKFDIDIPQDTQRQGRQLRGTQFPNRFVWIAGSTHPLEEQIVLDAHQQICGRLPGALLILVPRHPQRFAEVGEWLQAQGVSFARRSAAPGVSDTQSVVLIDTMGELQMCYAAADVAFVGGTLVAVGGHNLLEPAALAMPVLAGPNNFNAPDIARLLTASDALQVVSTATELSQAVTTMALDATLRHARGQNARRIVEQNRGAVAKVLALIEPEVRITR